MFIPSKLSKIHILFSETPVSEFETGWPNYPAQRGFESNLVLLISASRLQFVLVRFEVYRKIK
jgi:hypothetical protein